MVAAFMAMFLVGCNNGNELKKIVFEIDKRCPYSLGDWATLDQVKYVDNLVTMTYTTSEGIIDYDAVKANEEAFRTNTLMSYANNSDAGFKKMIDAIIKADADLNVVFNNEVGEEITMHFTSDELKTNRPTSDADPEKQLKSIMESTRLQTPSVVDEGLVLTDVVLDANYFTYVYDCDESEYDIDEMLSNIQEMKEAVLEDAIESGGTLAKNFFNLLKITHRGLAYKYVGSTSGKTCLVCFEPDEL